MSNRDWPTFSGKGNVFACVAKAKCPRLGSLVDKKASLVHGSVGWEVQGQRAAAMEGLLASAEPVQPLKKTSQYDTCHHMM